MNTSPTSEHSPYADVRETHSGLVLLCGERAYKVKRPVVTGFLDFGSRERRERAIARELELNRRLSPDVYLGISHLTDLDGGPGEPVLVMRRLPDRARLSELLDDPAATRTALTDLADLLARFHDRADRGPDIDRAARVDAVRGRWADLLSGLTDPPIDPAVTERITALVTRYLDGRKPLLDNRIADGRIVDGHGDLHAGDIFALPDGFRIIDCLDFDDDLRHLDRLDDIAFLAMDLEFLHHPRHAEELLDHYCALTNDPVPASLRHHYIAYRAIVRARVNCIRHEQGAPEAAAHAVRHTEIAVSHLDKATVRLALVGGLPGTGKSTLAAALAAATGALVVSSDTVRAELRSTGELPGHSGEYGRGAYSPRAKDRVYTEMLDLARTHLSTGRSVVLDASWTDPRHRDRAATLATETSTDPIELCCHAPQSIAAERIAARTGSNSEATAAIAAAMAETTPPWPTATVVDTTTSAEATLTQALRAWNSPTRRSPDTPVTASRRP
ncbi:AAA family ATPase [Nocardia terpenica]|uniref:Uncharacterized protein n=1 Tax=Nocardia terpenica TaxID=455432 RepID=A0A164NTM4_9NOCA|nr:AAA family ATPase [Nocardia terpenica]KZM74711.1 hypothetical protein AWN90_21885 [Nocardia terpenica]NQE93673.1 AAA family ATPase [Nocardia terpenica]